jgi:putative colanic acid biosynthesis UDP-glucose lipid carrier transferase
LVLADALVFILASDVAVLARRPAPARIPELTPTILLSAVIMSGTMWISGAYSRFASERLSAQFARAFLNCSAVFALLLLVGYATRRPAFASSPPLSAWYPATLIGLAAVRLLAYFSVDRWRRSGRLARVVAVVDLAGMGASLAHRIQRNDISELQFLGMFSRRHSAGYAIDDLVWITRSQRVDEIIIAAGGASESEVENVVEQLGAVPTNVHVCTTLQQTGLLHPEPSLVFGQAVLTVHRRPLDGWGAVLKRAEDLVVGGLILFLLLPLMGMIAVLIKLDSRGPVLFRQKRLGLNNTVFEILKFRTMVYAPGPEQDVPQARQNDPRVTRLGRLLRRTSLDELPQLFNVLRGDMSLVGPRPHAIPHNQHYSSVIGGYWCRHRVRPGITGWAQVNGLRGETDTVDKMRRRVEFDLDYIKSWSLVFDAKVLLRTVIVCLLDRAAY